MDKEGFRLGHSSLDIQQVGSYFPPIYPGYKDTSNGKRDYKKTVSRCREFYEYDSIAGTVINRMVDMAVTNLQNRQTSPITGKVNKQMFAYYNAIAAQLKPFLKHMALEFLLSGMAIPDATYRTEMGSRVADNLGRTRYTFPDDLWCRNIENIKLRKQPTGTKRLVFLEIPSEDVNLVLTKGEPNKKEEYLALLKKAPEYIADIEAGKRLLFLEDAYVLYRKLTTYNDFPIPYLQSALSTLEHKSRLRAADSATAKRIVEAIRQIKVGDKDFPADDDTISAEKSNFISQASSGESVFNWFTNHTIEIKWSYPPLDALLSEGKYTAANLEIFMALGFPRIWVNGETERSNAADNSTASVGPLATIKDMQEALLGWVKHLYQILADKNKFQKLPPEPYFQPITMADIANLIQYADAFYTSGAISKNTIALLFGETYANEYEQRLLEQEQDKKLEPELPANTQPTPDGNSNQVEDTSSEDTKPVLNV